MSTTIAFDPFALDAVADPYPHYERLRDRAPVAWLPDLNAWFVSRYADVVTVLHDPATYSSAEGMGALMTGRVGPQRVDAREVFGIDLRQLRVLIASDPPEHTRLRRLLSRAWARGLPLGRVRGRVHAPSLFAPLFPTTGDDRMVVTIHDVVPWTHPETLTPHGVAWHKAMAERARRFAAAVVVDTQAVADGLAEVLDFGDRVHVVGAAVSADFDAPGGSDADARAAALGLPERYVLSVGTLEPRKGLDHLVRAMRGDPG